MSRSHTEILVCPSCGTRQSFVVWDSINVTLNPDLKESLLKGDLTCFHCKHCGHDAHVEFDCLYHDQERNLMIWLKYPDARGRVEIDPVAKQLFPRFASMYTYRLVGSYHELLDKILVLDAGFSDLAIELFKLLVCIREGIDIVRPFHYAETRTSFLHGEVLVFALETENGFEQMQYPFKQFLQVTEPLLPKIVPAMADCSDDWPRVDRTYVLNLLQATGFLSKMAW